MIFYFLKKKNKKQKPPECILQSYRWKGTGWWKFQKEFETLMVRQCRVHAKKAFAAQEKDCTTCH